MTLIAVVGWTLAVTVAALGLLSGRRRRAQLARIAEAEHELRGPLTALALALGANTGGDRAALAAELARAGRALADLTAARAGDPAPGPSVIRVDLGCVVRDSVTAWRPAATAAGVDLAGVYPEGFLALADPVRLAQATGNLIANAIEHGGDRVRVHVSTAGGRARIEVSDAGPGLGRSPRAWSRRAHHGTRGHGLRVAARVAAQHGGELTVLGAHPHARGAQVSGAVFALTLPLLPTR